MPAIAVAFWAILIEFNHCILCENTAVFIIDWKATRWLWVTHHRNWLSFVHVEDHAVLQSLWNTTTAPLWQFRL